MIRRLGKRWQKLHHLVYVAAIAGVVHFYWLVKAEFACRFNMAPSWRSCWSSIVAMKWAKRKPAAVVCKSAIARAQEFF